MKKSKKVLLKLADNKKYYSMITFNSILSLSKYKINSNTFSTILTYIKNADSKHLPLYIVNTYQISTTPGSREENLIPFVILDCPIHYTILERSKFVYTKLMRSLNPFSEIKFVI